MAVLERMFKGSSEKNTRDDISLETLDTQELIEIATGTSNGEQRVGAIKLLNDSEILQKLAFGEHSGSIQRAARQRLAVLADNGQINLQQLQSDIKDLNLFLSIAAYSKNTDILQSHFENISEENTLIDIAVSGSSTAIRQLAASHIRSSDGLEKLAKASKGKDKAVYRAVKEKLTTEKEAAKEQSEINERIQVLCKSIEKHSNRIFDSRYIPKLNELKLQWSRVSEFANQNDGNRADRAFSICQEKINEQEKIAAAAAAQKQAENQAIERRTEIVNSLTLNFSKLYDLKQLDIDDIKAQLSNTLLDWEKASENFVPGKKETTKFESLCRAFEKLLDHCTNCGTVSQQIELLKKLDGPHSSEFQAASRTLRQSIKFSDGLLNEDSWPINLRTADTFLNERNKEKQELASLKHKLIQQTNNLIRKALSSIKQGNSKQAAGIRKTIDDKLAQLEQVPATLTKQLESLDEALVKLQDWKEYAVLPKKESLIERMQNLIGADMHPQNLAAHIKRLQEEWRSLSKSGLNTEDDVWDRFQEASNKAFEPCQGYFEEQSTIRKENLNKRSNLADKLTAYVDQEDWESANWKALEKKLTASLNEWRDYSPTDRAANKPVQKRFDTAIKKIKKHLNSEYQNNIDRKKELVSQAETLTNNGDMRAAAERVKSLQAQWKEVGITPRNMDQRLWRQFRTHCDKVFKQREEKSAEFKASLSENKATAIKLCEQAEAILQLSAEELANARSQLAELKKLFNELGTLPRESDKKLRDRFFKASRDYDAAIRQQKNQSKVDVWNNLFAVAESIQAVELASLNSEDSDKLCDEAQDLIGDIAKFPSNSRNILENRLAEAPQCDDQSLDGNEQELRLLCIRAEIMTESPTPAEDQELRMQYQLQSLQQNMGQNIKATPSEMTELAMEWLAAKPVKQDKYKTLLERFAKQRANLI